ncbi:MAG: hypothetical protein KDD33_10820 [Bdellovibrionales bacterium]|nr:hypothetical protein [Bdellovibrionales bacterium]
MSYFNIATRVLLLTGLFPILVQCGGESSSPQTPDDLIGQVDTGQCAHSPYDGPEADVANKSFAYQDSGYFGKMANTDHLDALLQASGVQAYRYIRSQGVDVYYIKEKSQSQCRYFTFAKKAPSDYRQKWRDKAGPNDGSNGATLLGLFLTYFSRSSTGDVRLVDPTILLRHDTQKWTILHEFTHYLFADSRSQEKFMKFNEEIATDMQTSNNDILLAKANFLEERSPEKALLLLMQWSRFFKLSHKLHSRNALEEFTIESMLNERYRAGRITLINPTLDTRNGIRYMQSNAAKVYPRYQKLVESIRDFRIQYFEHDWEDVQKQSKQVENQIQEQLDFMDQKLAQAAEALATESLSSLALSVDFSLDSPVWPVQHYDPQFDELQDRLYGIK